MNQVISGMLHTMLEAERELDQWDQPPSLYLAVEPVPWTTQGEPGLLKIDFEDDVWDGQPPFYTLMELARTLRHPSVSGLRLPGDVIRITGMVFFCEAWAVIRKKDELPTRDFGSLKDAPDRIEVKMASAVTVDGERLSAALERDSSDDIEIRHSEYGSTEDLDGRIFEALEKALAAFMSKVEWV